jgi:hypothetical protein
MIDPILRLAITMHGGKGVYALLLGSGVSRSSSIPTGWDIVQDLIRQLARAQKISLPDDPEAWYRQTTGKDGDYSELLDQLTHSATERGQILRGYFEPNDEDRDQGRKLPSKAHRAIAQLVKSGYVRVLVTTNFDRLMEQALAEEGIQPTVISTPDAVMGAIPLTHSPCTLIKIHGDYLDTRLRNTRTELSAYEKPLDDLLDRVFDEYGIVICGWSAEWDVALRAAIERCPAHRFGAYWTAYQGKLTGAAEKLISVRRAEVVQISGADEFFVDLAEKIRALDDLTIADPVPARVAVALMKRYLADPPPAINLRDLVAGEIERAHAALRSDRFSVNDHNATPDAALARLRAYETEMQTALGLLACGGYWCREDQHAILCQAVKRLADDTTPQNGFNLRLSLKLYPALLAFYTAGITAIANSSFTLLARLFALKIRTQRLEPEEFIEAVVTPDKILDHGEQQWVFSNRQLTPLNNHLFETLRDPVREYLPDDDQYDDAFDTFEYLIALACCSVHLTDENFRQAESGQFSWRVPLGRFLWNKHRSDDHIARRTQFELNGPRPELIDAIVQAGMFGPVSAGYARLHLVKRGFDQYLREARQHSGLY